MKPSDTSLPTRRESLSTVPSWLMLGALVGAVAMYSLHDRYFKSAEPTRAQVKAPAPVEVRRVIPPVVDVEAIFLQYQQHAIWENDLTEVAIWNPTTLKFSEFYEVARVKDQFYFRSITSLTRPVVEYHAEDGVPVRFTEPEEQRAKRLEHLPPIFRPPPPKL